MRTFTGSAIGFTVGRGWRSRLQFHGRCQNGRGAGCLGMSSVVEADVGRGSEDVDERRGTWESFSGRFHLVQPDFAENIGRGIAETHLVVASEQDSVEEVTPFFRDAGVALDATVASLLELEELPVAKAVFLFSKSFFVIFSPLRDLASDIFHDADFITRRQLARLASFRMRLADTVCNGVRSWESRVWG